MHVYLRTEVQLAKIQEGIAIKELHTCKNHIRHMHAKNIVYCKKTQKTQI